MNKKVSIGAAVSLAAAAVAITFCVTADILTSRFNRQMNNLISQRNMFDKLSQIESFITEHSYFQLSESVRDDSTAMALATALQNEGDIYARYYTAEEYSTVSKTTMGLGDGLGITLMNGEKGVMVYRVVNGSPAYTAGIKAGDYVSAVYDKNSDLIVSGVAEHNVVFSAINNNILSIGSFDIKRNDEIINVPVKAEEYNEATVWVEYVDNIAIVTISRFASNTDEAFIRIINDIDKNSAITGVVFDLRNNGGGVLASCAAMLDRLLPSGVVYTLVSKDGDEQSRYDSDEVNFSKRMVVLVNDASASCSELFACALHDYGKAVLVGTKTYGKCCVQDTFILSDGSAIKFTVAYINPPSSPNYEGRPLQPDIAIELTDEQSRLFYTLDYKTDPQLAGAIDCLNSNRAAQNAA